MHPLDLDEAQRHLEEWIETLHLVSIPGMRASIREGLETPVEECFDDLDW